MNTGKPTKILNVLVTLAEGLLLRSVSLGYPQIELVSHLEAGYTKDRGWLHPFHCHHLGISL